MSSAARHQTSALRIILGALCCLLALAVTSTAAQAKTPKAHKGHKISRIKTRAAVSSSDKRYGVVNVAGWGTAELKTAHGLGITDDREEFSPSKSFAQIDATFTAAADARVRLLPLLNQYGDPAKMDAASLAAWTKSFVARYGRGGTFWAARGSDSDLAPTAYELFNEVYGAWFYPVINPGAYADLFVAMATAGHTVDPSAKFLIAGTCDTNIGGTWKPWIDRLLDANSALAAQIGGVTVHPYGALDGDPNWSYGCLRKMHDDMLRRSLDVPVWITEVGQTTSGGDRPVSEAEQAADVSFYIKDAASLAWVAGVYIYGWRDSGTNKNDPEQNYGIIAADGRHKPAYSALQVALAAVAHNGPSIGTAVKLPRGATTAVTSVASTRALTHQA